MERLNGRAFDSGPYVPMLTQSPLCFKGRKVLHGRKNSLPEGSGRQSCMCVLFGFLQEGSHDVAFAYVGLDPDPAGDFRFLQDD